MFLLKQQYSKILQFLIADMYNFQLSLIQLYKKVKHWNLDTTGYSVNGADC